MKDTLMITLGAVAFILVLCISPLLILWGANTVLEAGNTGVYIPHSFWTYMAVFAILVPLKVRTNKQ